MASDDLALWKALYVLLYPTMFPCSKFYSCVRPHK